MTQTIEGSRWNWDPYLIVHSEQCFEQGLLQGPHLNDVQMTLLTAYTLRRRDQERQDKKDEFRRDLFIADPMRYKKLVDDEQAEKFRQQQQYGLEPGGKIEWRAPQSLEEAAEIGKEFEELERRRANATGSSGSEASWHDVGTSPADLGFLGADDMDLLQDEMRLQCR